MTMKAIRESFTTLWKTQNIWRYWKNIGKHSVSIWKKPPIPLYDSIMSY